MPIGSYPAHEQLDAAGALDLLLVRDTLLLEVLGVAVQDVDVGRVDIHVAEEVLVHEGVVGFRVLAWDADVLVHVEGDDIAEGDLAAFVGGHEVLVDSLRG